MKIKIIKDNAKVNQARYKKGDVLNVSQGIRDKHVGLGNAEDVKPKKEEK